MLTNLELGYWDISHKFGIFQWQVYLTYSILSLGISEIVQIYLWLGLASTRWTFSGSLSQPATARLVTKSRMPLQNFRPEMECSDKYVPKRRAPVKPLQAPLLYFSTARTVIPQPIFPKSLLPSFLNITKSFFRFWPIGNAAYHGHN